MIETLIIEKADAQVTHFQELFSKESDINTTAVGALTDAGALIDQTDFNVLLIGPSIAFEEALPLVTRLTRTHRSIGSVLVADKLTTDLLKQALRAGFRDVVENEPAEIVGAVRRAFEMTAPPAGDDAQHEPQPRRGRIITFFSTKGGVGKTVFATNTAVGLARKDDKRIVLLDLDHQFGDVGVMLGLRPERTIADLLPSIDRLDGDLLDGFLVKHASGLRALLSPTQHEISERLTQAQLEKIIDAARSSADLVIIDTPGSFTENILTVLDNSDCICLVTTLDVPSVKNTSIALQTLGLLNYPDSKIKVVLNRADSKVSLLPSEVERHLKHEIAVQVPSDRNVPRSVNEGNPLLMEDQKWPIINALNKIVDLAAAFEPEVSVGKRTGRVK